MRPDSKECSAMRAISIVLLASLLACPSLAQETPEVGDADKAVRSLLGSLKKVVDFGRAAEPVLASTRRNKQPVLIARSLMRSLSKRLRKLPVTETEVPKEQLQAACVEFARRLGQVVSMGASAFSAVDAAAAAAEGMEKEFLQKLRKRLDVQVAFAEINSYFVGDRAPGTFEGMFPKTEKLGRAGAEAMLSLYVDLTQASNVRNLAGEGVAQLGGKEDVAAVREIHQDKLEAQDLRDDAVVILARLGDRTEFDKEAAAYKAEIEKREAACAKAAKVHGEYLEEINSLKAVTDPTAEQKARLELLQKELPDRYRAVINGYFAVGSAYSSHAQHCLKLNDYANTEQFYKKTLENWLRVAVRIRNPQLNRNVNIAYYNLACIQCLQGKKDDAIDSMDKSFRWGYRNFDWCMKDGDLTNIRTDKRFVDLVEEVKSGRAKERWQKEQAARTGKPDGGSAPDGTP